MKDRIRILIADDHELFSAGVAALLKEFPQYEVSGICTRGDQVPAEALHLRPDVVILDVNMPGMNGLDAGRQLRHLLPGVRIILITMYSPADIGGDSATDLTDGYVLKDSGSAVLLEALEEVLAGRRYIDPAIYASNHHRDDRFVRRLKLSSRESEILQLIVQGLSNKEIASKLFLSELTIKTHRKNMMAKLGARNLAELLLKIQR